MNVRQLREHAGLSQQELASITGIPKDRIAKWEQGKGKPKVEDAKVLDNYFNEHLPQNGTTATETAQGGAKTSKPQSDNRSDKLTTTTAKIDYGMKPTNGNQGKDTPVDLNITIQIQAEATRLFAEAQIKDRDIMLALTRIIEDKNIKK